VSVFDASKHLLTCDCCLNTCGSGKEPFDAGVSGVPEGWTALHSKGSFFFACSPLCEVDVAAALIKACRPFTMRIV
jgi:hypothetical protein